MCCPAFLACLACLVAGLAGWPANKYMAQNEKDKFTKEELEDLDKLLDLEDEVIYKFYEKNVSNDFLKKNKVSSHLKKFKI